MVLIREGLSRLLVILSILATVSCQSAGQADRTPTVEGKIHEVSDNHGNLNTDIDEALVTEAGLQKGGKFLFTCNGQTFTATFGTTYDDVASGDWVGFINWEKKLRVARNAANAAQTSGCGLNDLVTITRLPSPG
jgi:S-adenosylmethionine hydrolase